MMRYVYAATWAAWCGNFIYDYANNRPLDFLEITIIVMALGMLAIKNLCGLTLVKESD